MGHRVLVATLGLGMFLAAGCCNPSAGIKAGEAKPRPVAGAAAGAGATTRPGSATRPLLPEPAEKAVRSLYAKARFHKIEHAQTLGVDVYTVHLARLATKVAVTSDGQILMVGHQVAVKDLPKGVADAVTRGTGTSMVRVTQDDVRAEVRQDGQAPVVAKVEPPRTFYEVQVLRASEPKYHKTCFRLNKDGSLLK